MTGIKVEWIDEQSLYRFSLLEEEEPLVVQPFKAPRYMRYGGATLPVGVLLAAEGATGLPQTDYAPLHEHVIQAGRILECVLIIAERGCYPLLAEKGNPLLPVSELTATRDIITSREAVGPELHPVTIDDVARLKLLHEFAHHQQTGAITRLTSDWPALLASDTWLGWSRDGILQGYLRLSEGENEIIIKETAAANDDYEPLLAHLASYTGDSYCFQIAFDHPLALRLYQEGAVRQQHLRGHYGLILNLRLLMVAIQRELSTRLRESRFYQYSGEIGMIIGNEILSIRIVRGSIIEILQRDTSKEGWPAFTLQGFLSFLFGQARVIDCLLSKEGSPQMIHIIDVLFPLQVAHLTSP